MKILNLIAKHCEVNIRYITKGINLYIPSTNEILLRNDNDSSMMKVGKALAGRPAFKNFSLAHELGHAFFYKEKIQSDKKARKIFGDFSAPYIGEKALWLAAISTKKKGFITKYAQTHPKEDWADCFAYVVLGEKIPKNPKIIEKCEFIRGKIDKLLR